MNKPMKVVLATRNPSKLEQIRQVFDGSGIEILSMEEAGIQGEAVEDGTTLEENARKKALYVFGRYDGWDWIMAEDTGLFIPALRNEPGIRAARWAGEGATTEEGQAFALKQLEGVEERVGSFATVVLLLSPTGQELRFKGEARGYFLNEPRCAPQPGMPYSGIFVPEEGGGLVWAEMPIEFENTISHRGKALAKARAFLLEQ